MIRKWMAWAACGVLLCGCAESARNSRPTTTPTQAGADTRPVDTSVTGDLALWARIADERRMTAA